MTEKEFTDHENYENIKKGYDFLCRVQASFTNGIIDPEEYKKILIRVKNYRDELLEKIKIEPSQKSLEEKIADIGANFHEPDIIAQATTTVQMFREDNVPFEPLSCPCCAKNAVTLTTIHHDSGDHQKDMSICTSCYIKVHSWWTKNTIGKLLPGSH